MVRLNKILNKGNMKTRSGFVSNSSSSSFIFVGFKTADIQDKNVNFQQLIQENFSKRTVDEFVSEYIKNDDEYEAYHAGKAPQSLWEDAYEYFKRDLVETNRPTGYTVYDVNGEGDTWYGKSVARVYDSLSQEIDIDKIEQLKKEIKTEFPNVTPKVMLTATQE